jgi:hypothetical protein
VSCIVLIPLQTAQAWVVSLYRVQRTFFPFKKWAWTR